MAISGAVGCSYFVSEIRQSQRAVSWFVSADVVEDTGYKVGLTKRASCSTFPYEAPEHAP